MWILIKLFCLLLHNKQPCRKLKINFIKKYKKFKFSHPINFAAKTHPQSTIHILYIFVCTFIFLTDNEVSLVFWCRWICLVCTIFLSFHVKSVEAIFFFNLKLHTERSFSYNCRGTSVCCVKICGKI